MKKTLRITALIGALLTGITASAGQENEQESAWQQSPERHYRFTAKSPTYSDFFAILKRGENKPDFFFAFKSENCSDEMNLPEPRQLEFLLNDGAVLASLECGTNGYRLLIPTTEEGLDYTFSTLSRTNGYASLYLEGDSEILIQIPTKNFRAAYDKVQKASKKAK